VEVHADGRHARVVHTGDGDAHDEAGPQAGHEAADRDRGPERGGRGDDGDHDGEGHRADLVPQVAVHADGRHAYVVHGGDPDAREGARHQEGRRAGAAVADGENSQTDDDNRHGEAENRQADVIANTAFLDLESDHGDEMHRPYSASDRSRSERQPARLPRLVIAQ
jgi:hypothetical protein